MSVKGICKYFGLSSTTVYRLKDAGASDSISDSILVGRSRPILVETVYAWIERLRAKQ
jgi:transposase